jgi:succinate dehydrogenase/fumarate reductase cytochrome b subunit
MKLIDVLVYSGLVLAVLFAVCYGLPYLIIALAILGAIHSYPQFKEWFCGPVRTNPVPPTA